MIRSKQPVECHPKSRVPIAVCAPLRLGFRHDEASDVGAVRDI